MLVQPSNIPDLLRQALATAGRATEDEWLRWKVLKEVMGALAEIDTDCSPAEACFACQRNATRVLGVADPYERDRERLNLDALAVEAEARKLVAGTQDPLAAALRLAALANRLDPGILETYTARAVLADFERAALPAMEMEELRQEISKAKTVLYILDGAGEVLFDKLVMEQLLPGRAVTAVVRRCPVLTSATREDAQAVGLPAEVRLMDPGEDTLGCPLQLCSSEFKDLLHAADIVLGKGEACYQTLHEMVRECWFLLACRTAETARHLGLKRGELALVKQ